MDPENVSFNMLQIYIDNNCWLSSVKEKKKRGASPYSFRKEREDIDNESELLI